MKNRFPREFYLPKGATKVADKNSTAVAYVYERAGVVYAAGFQGKAEKPAFHYRYRNPAQREKAVLSFFSNVQAAEKRRQDRRNERKSFTHTTKVGDIFKTCWGYDQTNVEFFEVVEVKGKHAILREIASASIDNGMGSERCVPQSGAFLKPRYEGDDTGLPIRRLIQEGGIKIDECRWASAWGKRVAGVVVGEAASRTAAGWGH